MKRVTDYPRPGQNEFAALYDDRNELLHAVKQVIDNTLPTERVGEREIVLFSEIDSADSILAAINESPRPALTMFLAVTGLSKGDVHKQLGFRGVYGIADTGDYLPHKDDRAQELAPLLVKHLSVDLVKETVLQQTAHRWTLDHRRHYRKTFEQEVKNTLLEAGIPLLPNRAVEENPDIAVPDTNSSVCIVGEIRRTNKQDRGNRIREFESEMRSHAETHPTAETVIVFEIAEELPQHKLNRNVANIKQELEDTVSGVYTRNELNNLVSDCRRWTSQIQPRIQQFTG